MERQPLNSSWLKSSGYDPATKTMHLEIQSDRKGKNGEIAHRHQVIAYAGVPQEKHDALRAESDAVDRGVVGASVGNHFHVNIKPFHVGKPINPQDQKDGALTWKELQTGKAVVPK
jgi:hypothetical protein